MTIDMNILSQVVTVITDGMEFIGVISPCLKDFVDACTLILPITIHIDEAKAQVKPLTRQLEISRKQLTNENAIKLTTDQPIKVTFENVSFSYPSRKEETILHNVSFTIDAGKTMALVGSSGSGKSTCVQLVLRFYEPTDGRIKINEHDITEFDIYNYNQAIGVVSQEPILFASSIQDNIRIGRNDATQDDVIEAAKQAHAHDFIMQLPQGYETIICDGCMTLSGGQRQRIALARALIRRPSLLILDEATSALDSSSEKIIQQTLQQTSKGRTTLVIAHRLSTIRHADWILVLKDGVVIEQGSHDDLIAAKNIYFDLFKNYQGETLNVQPIEEANINQSEDSSTEIILDQEINSVLTEKNEEIKESFVKEETELLIDESSPGSLHSLINLLKLNSPEWPYLVIASIFVLASCAVSPAYSISLVEAIRAFNECTTSARMKKLYVFTSIMFVLGIAVVVFRIIEVRFDDEYEQGCLSVAGIRLTNRLRIKTLECILRQEVAWFDETQNDVGSLCSQLSTDAHEIQEVITVS
ncbi:unnamed protein product [Rotaria sp. Silwood2]|nr:unnamed protein product [Rotaria sp. Silwood2]